MRRSLPLSHLKRFLLKAIATVFVLLIISVAGYAVSKTSAGNGYWNVSGLWNPSGVPTVADDVYINHAIIINSSEVYTINSLIINGKLTVNGTLIVNGDLSTGVNGELIMGPNATVIVKGNVILGNKCTLDLSSYFIVLGSFTKSGTANWGSISANNAHIYILGTTSTPYTYFTVCSDYSGTTLETTDPSCDGGTFEALVSHETDNSNPVISEIVQEAITAVTVPVSNLAPVSSCFCSGGSTILTISEVNAISVLKWYNGATLLSTTTTPAQPYNLSVSQTGTYSALYKIGTTWYQTNSAEITSVAVPTANISGTATVCQGESATLSVALTGSGPWNFTYTDGTTSQTVTNQSTSPYTVTVSPVSTKTYTLTGLSTASCTGTVSGSATITVAEILVSGAVSGGNSPICRGSSIGTLTLSGYSGTVIRWERQVNSGGWTSVGNGGNATYSEIPYSAGTWQYRAVVQSGSCGEAPSSSVSIEVDPTTVGGGIYTGNTPICEGSSTGTMHLTGYTGAIVGWEKRVDGGTWINIENTTDSYAEIPSSSGIWEYRALVQSGACSAVYSGSFTVVVNPTPIPTFSEAPGANECQNDDVVYTTQPGQSNYVWVVPGTVGTDYSITSGGIGSNNNTVTIKWLSTGNKTVTVNYRNSGGCPGESPATSTVTIDPIPEIGSFN